MHVKHKDKQTKIWKFDKYNTSDSALQLTLRVCDNNLNAFTSDLQSLRSKMIPCRDDVTSDGTRDSCDVFDTMAKICSAHSPEVSAGRLTQ